MKWNLLIAGLLFLHSTAQAETLECAGYPVSEPNSMEVTGTIEIENGVVVYGVLLFASLGKEGWTYFAPFSPVAKDASNFSSWFDAEAKGINIIVNGLYAGVSPELNPSYPLYKAIEKQNPFQGFPKRTFVVFDSNRKPYAETFCYAAKPTLKK